MLLGLNGICVKSHGGTDETGFANAIGVAVEMVSDDLVEKMRDHFETFDMAQKMSNNAAGSATEAEKMTEVVETPAKATPKTDQASSSAEDAG